jgi:polyhydroxyalkanoate synthase subunit PhaE
MEAWMTFAQQGSPETGRVIFDASTMQKLFDPAEWAKASAGGFDFALEHLAEGPTYATLWDLDRKILNAQKLLAERTKEIANYHAIVQAAWMKAFQRFVKELSNPAGAPIKSGREMIDLWIKVANETLIEMHRSQEFLEAQRRMTRSGTEYRLAEREIAEAFCEMHHIPTRTEVDEVQRIVCELRRELRRLRRELNAPEAEREARGLKTVE